MKRTKVKKLVLTDGTWYYENTSVGHSHFTDNPRKAWNFYCERIPSLNEKKRLHWELDTWTKDEPLVYNKPNRYGKVTRNTDVKIDRSKFVLKWITIIETIKEEPFNYEGFANIDKE
jgi:hypothetical protein